MMYLLSWVWAKFWHYKEADREFFHQTDRPIEIFFLYITIFSLSLLFTTTTHYPFYWLYLIWYSHVVISSCIHVLHISMNFLLSYCVLHYSSHTTCVCLPAVHSLPNEKYFG
jgi:hypothetical protein